ncbi:hypothetical protein C8Q80DRAFT_941418 [Daedaleopsis nitida]|nr:hypothetical protein C8Q80DRAFT_941418 [Daedaleopsis nitida]
MRTARITFYGVPQSAAGALARKGSLEVGVPRPVCVRTICRRDRSFLREPYGPRGQVDGRREEVDAGGICPNVSLQLVRNRLARGTGQDTTHLLVGYHWGFLLPMQIVDLSLVPPHLRFIMVLRVLSLF